MLLVNSQTADDHLEWCGLVESKIRLLIGNLERNQHISLAHVNPKCFDHKKGNNNNSSCSQNSSGNEDDKSSQTAAATAATGAGQQTSTLTTSPFCSMWFIGLEFERTENLNVDLTENIQNFTEHVIQHGVSNMYIYNSQLNSMKYLFKYVVRNVSSYKLLRNALKYL